MFPEIAAANVKTVLSGKANYSAPGPDAVNSFWRKKLPSVHRRGVQIFNQFLEYPNTFPNWIIEGRTIKIHNYHLTRRNLWFKKGIAGGARECFNFLIDRSVCHDATV